MIGQILLCVFAILIGTFAIVCYSIYASLIKSKNKIEEALSGIDVQLKKRYDLIPNILHIAAKFMEHEKTLFEEITKLRTEAISCKDLNNKVSLDNEIKNKMSQIILAVENYPQLKSDTAMVNAMKTYNEVEEHLAAARRFYNSALLIYNNAIEIFPSSVFANLMGYKKREYFKAEEHEKKPINAADYLK